MSEYKLKTGEVGVAALAAVPPCWHCSSNLLPEEPLNRPPKSRRRNYQILTKVIIVAVVVVVIIAIAVFIKKRK